MDGLAVGADGARIVIGSAILHHLLPELVPPINRHSTLRFFYGNAAQGDPARVLATVFPLFREIALACEGPIADALARPTSPLDTSVTKVIDNAIAGFCIRELGRVPASA